jgi:hypothetical protein
VLSSREAGSWACVSKAVPTEPELFINELRVHSDCIFKASLALAWRYGKARRK